MMEYWVMGLRLVEPTLRPVSLRAGSGLGEKMEKWVTCREPQGHAIGKIHIDKQVQDV